MRLVRAWQRLVCWAKWLWRAFPTTTRSGLEEGCCGLVCWEVEGGACPRELAGRVRTRERRYRGKPRLGDSEYGDGAWSTLGGL